MAWSREKLFPKLTIVCKKQLGNDTELIDLSRLAGGASAETWKLTVKQNGEVQPLVLRVTSGKEIFSAGIDIKTEALVQQQAYETGVPVSKVHFVVEEEDEIGAGYVMDLVEGESIARKILRDEEFTHARTIITDQCGDILARIHSIEKESLPEDLPDQSAEPYIKQLQSMYKAFGETLPVFDFVFRWLGENIPEKKRLTLVHGDFRNGNFMVNTEGICAVLDWELAHMGDPMEDLGWLCVNSWRFGNIDLPVGGFGHREELFTAYEKASGQQVDPKAVKFWEIFGSLKWGVICQLQAFAFLSGRVRSVEKAAIGRRISEAEIDILDSMRS